MTRYLPEVSVNDTLPAVAITGIAAVPTRPASVREYGGATAVHAVQTETPRIRWQFWQATSGGVLCYWAEAIEASVGIDSVTIYIANEYPKRSCLHTAVFHHENRHLLEAVQRVEKYAAQLEQEFASAAFIPRPTQPLAVPRDSVGHVLQQIAHEAYRIYRRAIRDLGEEMNSPSPIDTQEEYRRVIDSCRQVPEH